MMVLILHNFLILAEFGHSDRNGGILRKKRKNSAKIGMVGNYAAQLARCRKRRNLDASFRPDLNPIPLDWQSSTLTPRLLNNNKCNIWTHFAFNASLHDVCTNWSACWMISFVKTVTRNRKTISKLRKAERDQIMTNRTGVAALQPCNADCAEILNKSLTHRCRILLTDVLCNKIIHSFRLFL